MGGGSCERIGRGDRQEMVRDLVMEVLLLLFK